MARKTGEYKATVHTMQIEPVLSTEQAEDVGKWLGEVGSNKYDFISRKWIQTRVDSVNTRQPKMIINPHKLRCYGKHKWKFEYLDAAAIQDSLNEINSLMNVKTSVISRLDIALDAEEDYESNEKIIRMIELMIADKAGWTNRYTSDDPSTLIVETTVVNDAKKPNTTMECEHYNRSIFAQNKWINDPVVNRFEVRAMYGENRGKSITDIADAWTNVFEDLGRENFNHVVANAVEAEYRRWERYCRIGELDKSEATNNDRNRFYTGLYESDHIFTRGQLVKLYARDGQQRAVDNLLRAERWKKRFRLYTYKEVQAEIQALIKALDTFIGR